MAIYELLIKPREPDGTVVAARSQGIHIEPVDFLHLFQDEVPPPGWELVPADEQARILFWIRTNRWALHPDTSIQEAAAHLHRVGTPTLQMILDTVQYRERENARLAYFAQAGYDTNWGPGDLRYFGIVVADIEPADVAALLQNTLNRDGLPAGRTRRLAYENFIAQETADRWRDSGDVVPVPRGSAAVARSVIQANTQSREESGADRSGGRN